MSGELGVAIGVVMIAAVTVMVVAARRRRRARLLAGETPEAGYRREVAALRPRQTREDRAPGGPAIERYHERKRKDVRNRRSKRMWAAGSAGAVGIGPDGFPGGGGDGGAGCGGGCGGGGCGGGGS